jgi:hypothetical protein
MPEDNQTEALKDFLARHAKPYDPATDDYERPPFAADTKEGKNDPIYNAHLYHTKVPPRSIIPYVLHYTEPDDLVLDVFCGSGMTGVATQMCADPPADLLAQFPELKDHIGPRACILNDLSPAACHIAYNYNTPVDVEALRREFERIKAAVKGEFDWLYGTEHYEPGVDLYDPRNPDVASRLTNPPAGIAPSDLLNNEDRIWQLLTKDQVEARLGYPVTELPRDEEWGNLNVATVNQWIALPAMIHYTIWSDVYRCEGLVTIEEPTGRMSTRGKNAGRPMTTKKRVQRGCGKEIVIWDAAVGKDGEVAETFNCYHCSAPWKKWQIRRQRSIPVIVSLSATGLKRTRKGTEPRRRRCERRITFREAEILQQIESEHNPYWIPDTEMDTKGPRYRRDALQVRGIKKVTDFWTPRNLRAYASLWDKAKSVSEARIREALLFSLTGITYYITKKQAWGTGGGGLSGQLFVSSFPLEKNVREVWCRKMEQLIEAYSEARFLRSNEVAVSVSSATKLLIPDQSVDYVFTDPPFGSNIYYSEPNLLWEAWIQKTTNTALEAVVHRKTDGGTKRLPDYARLMEGAFSEIFRVLKPGRWCTVEFNNSDGAVFEAVKEAVRLAGFEIVNMLLFDKTQKTFQQVKGAGVGVVDKDVVFNLHKPGQAVIPVRREDQDLEQQVADSVRQHLQTLPERIKADPAKYSVEHRTTATINSMLMNALIPRGVSVEKLNLPFIDRVCARYFRKVGQHWYLRGEAVRGRDGALIEEEIAVKDELTAIAWLRQKIESRPMVIGEIKPLWMRATGLLSAAMSQTLVLDNLLADNFWRDPDTNRWREPTPEERERLNDDRSLRVLHDAERFVGGTFSRKPSNRELCDWIRVLFETCRELEEGDASVAQAHVGFDKTDGYRAIVNLSNRLIKQDLEPAAWNAAQKQGKVAGQRLAAAAQRSEVRTTKTAKDDKQTMFELGS